MVKTEIIQILSSLRQQLEEEAISKEDRARIRARITDVENEIHNTKWGN